MLTASKICQLVENFLNFFKAYLSKYIRKITVKFQQHLCCHIKVTIMLLNGLNFWAFQRGERRVVKGLRY